MEEASKKKRKAMRATIMDKRATMGIGATTAQEQQMLDDADLDDEAYYFKNENDALVEIRLEDSTKPEEGKFQDRFHRMMTSVQEERSDDDDDDGDEVEESFGSEYDQAEESLDENGSNEASKVHQYNLDVKPESKLIYSSQPMLPQLEKLETIKEDKPKADGDNEDQDEVKKRKYDKSLTDQIDKTRIEASKDLSQFIVEDHVEEEQPLRHTDKSKIIKKSKTRIRAATAKRKIVWSMLKMKKFLKKGIEGEDSFSEKNWFSKIVYIFIDAPMDFIRRLTIPPPDSEAWDRRLAAATPICCVFFIYAVTGFLTFTEVPHFSFWVLEGIAVMLSILICFTTPLNSGPKRGMIIFSLFSFLFSIVWIWFIANILIDLLGVVGLILGFKPSYLGITLLAWGNSVGDMMANQAVAKKGFARMALTGCFAGPLFNLLLGLGLSLVIQKLNGIPPQKFEITDNEAILPLMALGGEIIQVTAIAIIALFCKFHLRKAQGVVQIIYFILLMIVISIAAFTFAA